MSRTVFFDIGDTLVHRPTIGPGKRLARELGLTREDGRAITQLVFRERFASSDALAARLQSLFPTLDQGAVPIVQSVWRAQEEEPVEMPGATACIAAVADAGARIGVISNIWAPYAAGFRRACPDIVPRLQSWHLSYEVGIAKPDVDLYRTALAATGVRPEDAIMVGDSVEKDVVPALALGMGAIWVPGPLAGAPPRALADGAVAARDLAEVQRLLLAALDGPESPRVRLSAASARAIESP